MNRLTLADLEELERLEAAATGDPWIIGNDDLTIQSEVKIGEDKTVAGQLYWDSGGVAETFDAALIVAARNRLKDLIALAKVGLLAQEKAP